jgi:hypothetical protein
VHSRESFDRICGELKREGLQPQGGILGLGERARGGCACSWARAHVSSLSVRACPLSPTRARTGYYDANVLVRALSERGLEVRWFDRRRGLDALDLDAVEGLVLNRPRKTLIFFTTRHWLAIVKRDGARRRRRAAPRRAAAPDRRAQGSL